MTTILASMENSLLVAESTRDGWKIHESLKNCNQICIATDPQTTDRTYCGSFDAGLWKTDDSGQTWERPR